MNPDFRTERKRYHFSSWRLHRGLSQVELAERMGTTPSTISQIEAGKVGFSVQILEAWAKVLDCTVGDLLMTDPRKGPSVWTTWQRIPDERKELALSVLQQFAAPNSEATKFYFNKNFDR